MIEKVLLSEWQWQACFATAKEQIKWVTPLKYESHWPNTVEKRVVGTGGEAGAAKYLNLYWPMKIGGDGGYDLVSRYGGKIQVRARRDGDWEESWSSDAIIGTTYVFAQTVIKEHVLLLGWLLGEELQERGKPVGTDWKIKIVLLHDMSWLK